MTVRLGINGFGRIGRSAFRSSLERTDVDIVAINHTCDDAAYLIHALTYDTTHGTSKYAGCMDILDDADEQGRRKQYLVVYSPSSGAERTVLAKALLFSQRDATKLDWSAARVDIVLECTGKLKTKEAASAHLAPKPTTVAASTGSASTAVTSLSTPMPPPPPSPPRYVIISAPSSDARTFVYGVNHGDFDADADRIVSNASCTTNALAPLVHMLERLYGVDQGMMSTVHASTASQKVLDGFSSKRTDWRSGRCASANIIPTSTGAAKALSKVLPWTEGRLHGISIRVPVCNVSMIDLTVQLSRPCPSKEEMMRNLDRLAASDPALATVFASTDLALVSSDFIGRQESCIADADASCRLGDNWYKIIAWYDNETGYATRLLDLARHMDLKSKAAAAVVPVACQVALPPSAVSLTAAAI
ncbi:uncharacterized protein PFL1_01518 [Pseudozyma flocculosa PF-1]|uniref:Related to Glyceraldehyde-3-phosphate dehydrogenase, cytosolic n=1 Tax=Pseudozyma flocculosa TaxID=84751 RepID=A0A5C3FEK4_9BASI|nr:uncharacterized protein PFL1_01518 [Pseudozyma flocculosa PF-1]EPQ31334.1 hypothetical protein PFL1_01518 [Pseudozyma flocculosa PF-1]SPO41799.1 related to Glyceraldehyde-3-phosphate dehydrogenase, cytosolic [Pseudozyma flocculosa]